MDDARVVGRLHGIGDLPADVERVRERDASGLDLDPVPERVPFDQFQNQGRGALAVLHAVNLCDVRVVERGEQSSFTLEPGPALGVCGHRVGQHLQGNVAAQPGVVGAIHHAHASGADLAHNFRVP